MSDMKVPTNAVIHCPVCFQRPEFFEIEAVEGKSHSFYGGLLRVFDRARIASFVLRPCGDRMVHWQYTVQEVAGVEVQSWNLIPAVTDE